MNAKLQYNLGAPDLQILLALVRGGTLAAAAERLQVDGSTVFRALQRMEGGLGQRLFERSRAGYRPTDLAVALAQRAERIESELESARSEAQRQRAHVAGTLRLTTTDTLLHGLLAPELVALRRAHPLLQFEVSPPTSSPTSLGATRISRCAPPTGHRNTWWVGISGLSAWPCTRRTLPPMHTRKPTGRNCPG